MSKYVDEIIDSLKSNPLDWVDYRGFGAKKGETIVWGYGNTRILSTIGVSINGEVMPTTYVDNWKLEVAIMKWYKSIPLAHLQKINP